MPNKTIINTITKIIKNHESGFVLQSSKSNPLVIVEVNIKARREAQRKVDLQQNADAHKNLRSGFKI